MLINKICKTCGVGKEWDKAAATRKASGFMGRLCWDCYKVAYATPERLNANNEAKRKYRAKLREARGPEYLIAFAQRKARSALPKEGYGFVYMLTYANGMRYIGSTQTSIARRCQSHKHDAKRGTSELHLAWQQLGRPTDELLVEVPLFVLLATEEVAIIEHGTLWPHGYNKTLPFSKNI